MFENTISAERHALLEQLVSKPVMRDFYMAGGSALALYLGHRWSEDLDFFINREFDTFQLAGVLAVEEGFILTGQEPGTLHCFINNVKVSFLHYPYPMLEEGLEYKGVKLAAPIDIALMKLVALVQRGTKKDFVDLYFIDRGKLRFEVILERFSEKYPAKVFQPLVILKSLGYFEDAEPEIMPRLFREVTWPEIKRHFISRQKELTAKIIF